MKRYQGSLTSKLPQTGTSIFAIMSKMANEHNAINLSQGFPDFPVQGSLIDLVTKYMKLGYNQYAPMEGIPELREMIAHKVKKTYHTAYHPEKEITITAGATQALYTAISTFVKDEDEVIVFEPAYDSYAPSVKLNGGMIKYSPLVYPDFHIDWEKLPQLISSRTKMIILNSPHNPTGAVINPDDLQKLEKLIRNRDIIILSDEVYEHLIYDGIRHESLCLYPELASRTLVVGSFGKIFQTTGWKIGYVLAPEDLMREFRKVHQFIVFTCNAPVQYAFAEFLKDENNYRHLSAFFQAKRNYFVNLVRESRFEVIPSYGTYFQLLGYGKITDEKDRLYAERLVHENGIATIPVSCFYHDQTDHKVLRFCFAKADETLEKAANILCKI
ncbi:MAG: methionine aminotransferase [Bacteroidales bacterium]|nr:aminotransferase class I/II-fold pyridoxal phosphate-dependent enzyme [Lentimicrobiaceae bacterium]MDD5693833.1 methionine aminotransferase [Bacteroidales bacterium]